MGFLDGLLKQAMGGPGEATSLAGLVGAFQKKGLGDVISGWISTGPNPPISAAQVSKVPDTSSLESSLTSLPSGLGQ